MKRGSRDYITLSVFSYERLVLHRRGDNRELSVLGKVGMLHFTIPLSVAEEEWLSATPSWCDEDPERTVSA